MLERFPTQSPIKPRTQRKVSIITPLVLLLVLLTVSFSNTGHCGTPSFAKTNETLERISRDPKASRDQWTKAIHSFLEIYRTGKDRAAANKSLFLAGHASILLYRRSGKGEDLDRAIRWLYEYTQTTRSGPSRIMGLKELKTAHLLKRRTSHISRADSATAIAPKTIRSESHPSAPYEAQQPPVPVPQGQALSRWASAAKAPPALTPNRWIGNPFCHPETEHQTTKPKPSEADSANARSAILDPQPPRSGKENAPCPVSGQSSERKIPPGPPLEREGKEAMPAPPTYKGGLGAKQTVADSRRGSSFSTAIERLPCPPEPLSPHAGNDSQACQQIASLPAGTVRDGHPPVVRRIENPLKELVIVLDPGHGGKDPGAVSKDGRMKEKDIALEVANLLKKRLLSAVPGIKVEMTRTDDKFLTLQERTAIANSLNADLFISLHCNADSDTSSRGVETFYLSKASSPRAMRMAAKENGIPLATMSDLQATLLDLMLTSKRSESAKLAKTVQSCLVKNLAKAAPKIRDRGIKRAPFYVLIGAKMPAILVECAFISNGREERKLTSTRYLDSVALGIATGAATYLRELRGKSL